jgi:hypothetical protein
MRKDFKRIDLSHRSGLTLDAEGAYLRLLWLPSGVRIWVSVGWP